MELNPNLLDAVKDTIFEEIFSLTDQQIVVFSKEKFTVEIAEGEKVIGELSPLEAAFFILSHEYALKAEKEKENPETYDLYATKNNGCGKIGWGLVKLRLSSNMECLGLRKNNKIVEFCPKKKSFEEFVPDLLQFFKSLGIDADIEFIKVK